MEPGNKPGSQGDYMKSGIVAVLACTVLGGCNPIDREEDARSEVLTVAASTSTADKACGPDYELGDPRYPSLLAAKKKSLTDYGYPADAIALLDKDGACVAAISQAPERISIRTITPSGDKSTFEWTEDDERIARDDLKSGKIQAYYKFNVPRSFACCHEQKYDSRPDYNPDDDVNAVVVIRCTKSGTSMPCK